jgi:hypothetical protein
MFMMPENIGDGGKFIGVRATSEEGSNAAFSMFVPTTLLNWMLIDTSGVV